MEVKMREVSVYVKTEQIDKLGNKDTIKIKSNGNMIWEKHITVEWFRMK